MPGQSIELPVWADPTALPTPPTDPGAGAPNITGLDVNSTLLVTAAGGDVTVVWGTAAFPSSSFVVPQGSTLVVRVGAPVARAVGAGATLSYGRTAIAQLSGASGNVIP